MWNKPTAAVKCPKGDCMHYAKSPTDPPCRSCTCNREAVSVCREFKYESKLKGDAHENRTRTKA